MEKIASFTIDHTKLNPGIYVSRVDKIAKYNITTLDIRVKKPNYEDAMSSACAHTIEHLGATFFRNSTKWKDKVIYFGPMGCLTGFYLILKGTYTPGTKTYDEVVEFIMDMFRFTVKYEGKIPGASAVECGNYKLMDLTSAQFLAANMLTLYETFETLEYVYPGETSTLLYKRAQEKFKAEHPKSNALF